MKIDVAFSPRELADRELKGRRCVVLDIFRATTSMITAFQHGCRRIIPVTTVEEARTLAAGPPKACLLAGERKGVRIEGFALGNSPRDFMREFEPAQTIVMTTTNGTKAIKAAAGADAVLIGAFLNAEAVCGQLAGGPGDILIVCAGTNGKISLEDALCAGLFADILGKNERNELTDAARAALLMYGAVAGRLAEAAANSSHGRYLSTIGFAEDLETCLRVSTVAVVPAYHNGEILVPG